MGEQESCEKVGDEGAVDIGELGFERFDMRRWWEEKESSSSCELARSAEEE